jgi:hypothetical protein
VTLAQVVGVNAHVGEGADDVIGAHARRAR